MRGAHTLLFDNTILVIDYQPVSLWQGASPAKEITYALPLHYKLSLFILVLRRNDSSASLFEPLLVRIETFQHLKDIALEAMRVHIEGAKLTKLF